MAHMTNIKWSKIPLGLVTWYSSSIANFPGPKGYNSMEAKIRSKDGVYPTFRR